MSPHTAAAPPRRNRRSRLLLAVGGALATVGLALTGVGVFAGLSAVASNTTAETVASGTLKLTLAAATGSAGFTSSISNLAPGDVVNRYIDVTNGGTLDGQALTLAASDSVGSKLSTDATNGLHVTVSQCSTTWTVASGSCSGTTTVAQSNVALSALGTPVSVVGGSVTAGTVLHLQVSVTLPNQTETTTNGVLPGGTIQGLSANLTWTFTEAQRTATTTNS